MQQNIEDLKNAIAFFDGISDVVYSKIVRKDLSNVSVSFENMEPFGIEDSYNYEDKAAYGNNEGDPKDWMEDLRYRFDVEKMRADIIKSLQQQ